MRWGVLGQPVRKRFLLCFNNGPCVRCTRRWDTDNESAADTELRFDGDRSLHQLDKVPDHGQAETCPFVRTSGVALHLGELFEDFLLRLRRNPDALILDFDAELGWLMGDFELDVIGASRIRKFKSVAEEVPYDRVEFFEIAIEGRRSFVFAKISAVPSQGIFEDQALGEIIRVLQELRDRYKLRAELEFAALRFGEIQNGVHLELERLRKLQRFVELAFGQFGDRSKMVPPNEI